MKQSRTWQQNSSILLNVKNKKEGLVKRKVTIKEMAQIS